MLWKLTVGLTALMVLFALLVREVPWFGPWFANSLRSLLGADAVTQLEQLGASLEDHAKRVFRGRQAPRSLDEMRPGVPLANAPERAPEPSDVPSFRPQDVGAMGRRVAATNDGIWRAVADPARPTARPLLFETMLHPDEKRSWAEVFVVAADVAELELYAVAGTIEPEATTREGVAAERNGLIPRERVPALVLAFNGGFMTRHGRHGMHVAGLTLVSPQPRLCTLLGLEDGQLMIGTWSSLANEVAPASSDGNLRFWRQTAPCMYEHGVINPLLRDEDTRNWGATLEGKVVIRRSAIGLNPERSIVFVAVSNDTTAHAMAEAMHHAGASDVAQLDVNWSYPKILIFPIGADGRRYARGLFEGFLFSDDDYIRQPSRRDFFYLVRREPK